MEANQPLTSSGTGHVTLQRPVVHNSETRPIRLYSLQEKTFFSSYITNWHPLPIKGEEAHQQEGTDAGRQS